MAPSQRFPIPQGTLDMLVLQILSLEPAHGYRITQREHGVVVYLTDASGTRFDPRPDPSDIPISVALGPGDSVDISRTFSLPPGDPPTGLVIAHEGGFQMGWLMIGQGPFRRPPIVPLAGK